LFGCLPWFEEEISYSGGDPLFQRIVSFSSSTKVGEEELTHISREHYKFIPQPRFCPSYGFRHKNVMKDERREDEKIA
jgi:hypothetical protein